MSAFINASKIRVSRLDARNPFREGSDSARYFESIRSAGTNGLAFSDFVKKRPTAKRMSARTFVYVTVRKGLVKAIGV